MILPDLSTAENLGPRYIGVCGEEIKVTLFGVNDLKDLTVIEDFYFDGNTYIKHVNNIYYVYSNCNWISFKKI